MLFPEEFIKRISTQNYIDSESLLDALSAPSPVSIRMNRKKSGGVPVDSERVAWSTDGYYLKTRPSFTADPFFHSGCYYPQEASGMFLEQVFRQTCPSSNLTVLDLCGAPGGKSILLADMLEEKGFLIANEVIRSRASILAETATKWGSGNIIVTQSDPSAFGRLPDFFDVILVDAPCSGEGMFRTEIARSEWSEGNTVLCSERQKRILLDVWPCLKEDGILIYSTCTFNPGENEEIIKWLTSDGRAECIELKTENYRGITGIDYNGITGYGFHPGKIKGEGFFISAIRKKEKCHHPGKERRVLSDSRPTRIETDAAMRISGFGADRLVRAGEGLTALPCDASLLTRIASAVKVIKPGTVIGNMKNNDLIPSHELAMSVRLNRHAFPEYELNRDESLAFLRRDPLMESGFQHGWGIVKHAGVPLGFIKNIGKRTNNYYPVEMRIRMTPQELAGKEIIEWE